MPAPLAAARAMRTARRLAPFAAEAYRRWQSLTPEQKERYRQMARQYAERGRYAMEQSQARRRSRRRVR